MSARKYKIMTINKEEHHMSNVCKDEVLRRISFTLAILKMSPPFSCRKALGISYPNHHLKAQVWLKGPGSLP